VWWAGWRWKKWEIWRGRRKAEAGERRGEDMLASEQVEHGHSHRPNAKGPHTEAAEAMIKDDALRDAAKKVRAVVSW
jgi:hypothetical protein